MIATAMTGLAFEDLLGRSAGRCRGELPSLSRQSRPPCRGACEGCRSESAGTLENAKIAVKYGGFKKLKRPNKFDRFMLL